MGLDLATVTAADFLDQRGTAFRLGFTAPDVSLILTEIREFGGNRSGGGFVLTFEGPADMHLPQATHALTHPAMGEAEIFLVPIQPRPGASLYEAVFG